MRFLDAPVSAIARRLSASGLSTPSVRGLAPLRELASERAWQSSEVDARALARSRSSDAARASVAQLAERALGAMRANVRDEAGRRGPLLSLAADLDARFAATDEAEWMDDPAFDRDTRVKVLGHLDHLNGVVGSYEAFFAELRPFLRRDGKPTRVLDLASGHAGFAIEAARIAKREGLALEITATDLVREYLDLGEAVARREGLAIDFEVQDALDLSNVEAGTFDLVVCTQSLHHFPAGLVAVLASEASRIAGRAVVLIDGYRTRVHATLISMLGVVRFADLAFTHDTWVSFRRFFVPEELGLLARVGAPDAHVEARWAPPAHCVVVLTRHR